MNAPAPAVVTAAVLDDEVEHAQLQAAWHSPRGFIGWMMRVDHRSIGKRYIATAFVFFIARRHLAVLMRVQLAGPAESFARSGSVQSAVHRARHGDDVPVRGAGDGSDGRLPGAADGRHAQHRLSALECVQLLGLSVRRLDAVHRAHSRISARTSGWFNYVPLSGPQYGAGKRSDFWSQLITFTEVSGLAVAVEIVVDGVQAARAGHVSQSHPAVRLGDAGHGFMIIFAMPSVMLAARC